MDFQIPNVVFGWKICGGIWKRKGKSSHVLLTAYKSTLAMDFIATNSPPILPLNQKCGLRVGLDGKMSGILASHSMLYHGGTNFGRTTGGPFIATSYDYDAPIDEYGLLRQPKWGHLKDVHKAIKLCEPAMVGIGPTITSLGPNLEINSVATIPQFTHQSLNDNIGASEAFLTDSQGGSQTVLHVESLGHVIGTKRCCNDMSFLDGSGKGNRGNAKVAIEVPITLVPGKNRIDLLSLTVRLQNPINIVQNYGAFFDKWGAGVTGPVKLKGLNNGSTIDLFSRQWTYQVISSSPSLAPEKKERLLLGYTPCIL
ncbi:hypothetical protein HYC85_002512 [Camellia sinensis]|uniref:beta-galactosidase n=1 Tax=Camellia sinensis TaxID=4442 RepID=A0A7J7I8G8_CAMSI|nr:hypothetical protein HYC85_002512 [Camellia sinensis]